MAADSDAFMNTEERDHSPYRPTSLASLLCLDRVQRLKEARTEAAHEIEELKASKQEAFKKFEQEVINRMQLSYSASSPCLTIYDCRRGRPILILLVSFFPSPSCCGTIIACWIIGSNIAACRGGD